MTDLEIRESIAAYIAGDVAPHELADRLENESWDMGPGPTQALAAAVLRLLAEHGNGDWTDRELRERLGVLSRIYWFDQAARTSRLDSVSVVIRQDQPSASVERWRAAESV